VSSTPEKRPKGTKAKAAPKARAARRRRRAPSHDAIAKRAYDLYLSEGGGDHVAHWLAAERELSES
jgi:hypothetical protein